MAIIQNLTDRRKNRVRKKLKEANRKLHSRIYFQVSNKHLYAQLIDHHGKTLLSLASFSKDVAEKGKSKVVAKKLAESFVLNLSSKGFDLQNQYVLDRGSKLYHGRVKVFAESLREKGIKI